MLARTKDHILETLFKDIVIHLNAGLIDADIRKRFRNC